MTRVLKERTFSGTTNPEAASWENEHRQIAREATDEGIVLLKNAGYQITNEDWISGYDQIYEKARQDWKNDINARASQTGGDVMDFFTVYSTTPFIMPTGDPVKVPEALQKCYYCYQCGRTGGPVLYR